MMCFKEDLYSNLRQSVVRKAILFRVWEPGNNELISVHINIHINVHLGTQAHLLYTLLVCMNKLHKSVFSHFAQGE